MHMCVRECTILYAGLSPSVTLIQTQTISSNFKAFTNILPWDEREQIVSV